MKALKTLVFLLFAASASAQEVSSQVPKFRANTLYVEAGGPAGYYSLNYQHKFKLSGKLGITAGAYVTPFIMYRWTRDGYAYSPRVGGQVQFMYSTGRHEIGLGAALTMYAYYYGKTGEFQKPAPAEFAQLTYGYTFRNNLYVGLAFTPQLADQKDTEFVPWGGLRFGYKF